MGWPCLTSLIACTSFDDKCLCFSLESKTLILRNDNHGAGKDRGVGNRQNLVKLHNSIVLC